MAAMRLPEFKVIPDCKYDLRTMETVNYGDRNVD